MAKGDKITLHTTMGTHLIVEARQNGRSVELEIEKLGQLQVATCRETTRGGTNVRTVYVAMTNIVSIDKEVRGE